MCLRLLALGLPYVLGSTPGPAPNVLAARPPTQKLRKEKAREGTVRNGLRERPVASACLVLLLLTFCPFAHARQRTSRVVLTNGDVLEMYKAGVPADVIVAKIKHSQTRFDTSPKALIGLKAARLPTSVLMAMVDATSLSTSTSALRPCLSGGDPLNRCAVATSLPALPSVPASQLSPWSGTTVPDRIQKGSLPILPFGAAFNSEPEPTWEAEFAFAGQLYPSFVLELEGGSSQFAQHLPPNYVGDPLGMAGVKIQCTKAEEHVTVTTVVDGLSQTSTLETTLGNIGQYYHIFPFIRYDTAKLQTISEPYPTTVEYSVQVDEANEGQATLTAEVHSINDVPFAVQLNSGETKELEPLFAGYVGENNPVVEQLLQAALSVRAVNQFDGYQGGPQGVEPQVFAVWNILQRSHVHYSSTATASAESPWGWVSVGMPQARILSQSVRFPDQSLRDQQANCIDGAVFFASVLYKIGIDPLLVVLPGHAFVGYFIDPEHRHPQFLETTLVGQGPMPLNLRFGALYPIATTASWKEFLNAVHYGNLEFDTRVRPYLGRDHRYMVIDIQKARDLGINPIPRPF
jgi:hypothetical protein